MVGSASRLEAMARLRPAKLNARSFAASVVKFAEGRRHRRLIEAPATNRLASSLRSQQSENGLR